MALNRTRASTSVYVVPRHVFANRAVAVVNAVQGIIRGYICIWGDPDHRDAYGTYFDRDRIPDMGLERGMHRRPIMYEHAQDGRVRKATVGTIETYGYDDVGIWYIGTLDRSSPHFARIVDELRRGILKTSSATMDHTGDFYEDGAFLTWILGELSLTKSPAEERMPSTVLLRSAQGEHEVPSADANAHPHSTVTSTKRRTGIMPPELQQIIQDLLAQGLTMEEIIAAIQQFAAQSATPPDGQSPAPAPAATEGVPAMSAPAPTLSQPQAPRNMDALIRSLQAMGEQRKRQTEMETLRSQQTQMQQQMQDFIAQQTAQRNAPPVQPSGRPGALPQGGGSGAAITGMRDLRYAHMSASDMWLVRSVLKDNQVQTTEDFNRAMAHKTFAGVEKDALPVDAEYKASIRSSYKRADDFMASDISGQGLDWVGKFYASQIWEKARIECQLLAEMTSRGMQVIEVPDGAKDATVFLESSDPTWYTTAQANDVDITGRPEVVTQVGFVGSASVGVEPGELTAAVGYTDILAEDSMIAIAPQINSQFQLSAVEIIEAAMLNGDSQTAASTNINLIDGTPATGLVKPYYLVSNGILKLALVTNTQLARDASGVLNENSFQATTMKLPRTLRGKKAKLLYVMDPDTYEAALAIPAFKTIDVAGQNYTLLTGELPPKINGIKPIQSGQMALANSAGKVPAAGGTLGRIAAPYCPYWALVWKRELSFENARFALSKTNVIIGSLRMAMRHRSTDAVGLSYNLPVSVAA